MPLAPSPRTWTGGDRVDAKKMNSEVRDALAYLLKPPRVHVSRSLSFQTGIPITTWTNIAFDTEIVDEWNMWVPTDPTKVWCQVPGWYELTYGLSTSNNGTGQRFVGTALNGITSQPTHSQRYDHRPAEESGGSHSTGPITTIRYLNIGDFVVLRLYHNASTTVDTHYYTIANESHYLAPFLHMTWISK